MRAFTDQSTLTDGSLALALAPALTPGGIVDNPNFFRGIAVYPQVLARGLLVLADITSTRYFKYTPVAMRDPVLSAQGEMLRAECFSACNGVYARLDLLQSGFDGQIGYGTTNVDIGMELRTALTYIRQEDKMHVTIGGNGLKAAYSGRADENIIRAGRCVHERPVKMPDRWIRALGNAAGIHREMKSAFSLNKPQAQAFIVSLPPATGKNQAGWLAYTCAGIKLMPGQKAGAVYISGLHRLSALKRIMTNVLGITFYMPTSGEPGAFMIMTELPGARIWLSLTAETWHGYSGEGALLPSLARSELLDDALSIGSALHFDAAVNEMQMAKQRHIDRSRVQSALALLAVSGKLGFDAYDNTYFHRELPDDADRILKDNPRLAGAKKLLDKVEKIGPKEWIVHSGRTDYRVLYDSEEGAQKAKCTCTWYLNHANERGVCKHILAVQLKGEECE